jgi:hypothetical protein
MATIEELRWVPKGSTKIAHKTTGAVVYAYPSGAKFGLVGYAPKAKKPTFHFVLKDEEGREREATRFFRSIEEKQARVANSRAEAAAYQHAVQVGHIFVMSWGYEQTNVNFYQVTRLIGRRTVAVRPIRSIDATPSNYGGSSMSGKVLPHRDDFSGEEIVKKVWQGNRIKMTSYSSAYIWDGLPRYCSWYA